VFSQVRLNHLTAESRAAMATFAAQPMAHQRLLFLFNAQHISDDTFRVNMDTGVLGAAADSELVPSILADLLLHHMDFLRLSSELPTLEHRVVTGALYPQAATSMEE
jgi:hypothetical protein